METSRSAFFRRALLGLCSVALLAFSAAALAQPREAVATDQLRHARTLSSHEVIERAADRRWTAVELTRSGGDIAIQAADKPVLVSNADKLADVVQALPLNAKLSFDELRNEVKLEELTLRPTDRWAAQSAPVKEFYPLVTKAHEDLARAALPVLSAEPTPQQEQAFVQQAILTEQAVVQAYASLAPEQRAEGRILVDQFVDLHGTNKRNKAVYGRDDQYPPLAYERIYQNSRSALALIRAGETQSYCSGVLVGHSLALTNQHCIQGELISDLRAQFNYELDLKGDPLTRRSFRVAKVVVNGATLTPALDIALLEIAPSTDTPTPERPGDVFKPQCLSTARLKRDTALYLVGHPLGRPRTVHDYAFVFFPFRVTPQERIELELLVRSEFKDVVDEQDQLDAFRTSYRAATLEGQDVFEHFSTQFEGQPTIGADSDTYHGNSGSPAFSRRTHGVVGILFAGQPDVDEPWNPGWRSHEAILPIGHVIAQLDAAQPTWRDAASGVCIGD